LQRPENFIYSDMGLYVGLARRMVAHVPLSRPDVTHPLRQAAVPSFLMSSSYDLGRAVSFQLVICCLVPLAVGALGLAAYGRRTGLTAVVFTSRYCSFIQ